MVDKVVFYNLTMFDIGVGMKTKMFVGGAEPELQHHFFVSFGAVSDHDIGRREGAVQP